MNKLNRMCKEYQKLNLLLISIIGKKQIFYHIKKIEKKAELNNKSIALNVLYVPYNTETIRHSYKSKYNKERENQATLLMIIDGEKWHYLAAKKVSALLRGLISKHGDFYCLNYFHSYSTKDKLKNHYNVCKSDDFCYVEMSKEDNEILKYDHGEKSVKVLFIIYADLRIFAQKNEHLS